MTCHFFQSDDGTRGFVCTRSNQSPEEKGPKAPAQGKWGGKRLPLHFADRCAEAVLNAIGPFCKRAEIAGSIRRRRPFCGDVDIVAEVEDMAGLKQRCREHCEVLKDGEQNYLLRAKSGVEVDIFFCQQRVGDRFESWPSNWGSLMICRTGSREHNIYLVERAKKLGLRWHPYQGVFKGDQLVASETEQDIFYTLQLDYIEPEARER